MASPSLLRFARLLHLYFGIFIAPAILFFAFTGALQTFNLHETSSGSSYIPPRWAVVLGQIHKKQTAIVGPPRSHAPAAPLKHESPDPGRATSSTPPSVPPPTRHALPLKIFFLLVSVGLFSSTITGIYMSLRYNRDRVVLSTLLFAGTIIPVILIFV